MEKPLQIAYRDIEKTEALESLIREKIAKLEKLHDRITSCHVAVERPQRHQDSGSPYRVRIDVRVPPGHELIARHEPGQGEMHDSLELIIRDTFESVWRQLRKVKEKQQGDTKKHPDQQAVAVVEEIFPDEDYGFLRTVEGRRIYFHRNSVLQNDFDRLREGTGVSIAVEMGDDGPQASTVHIVDQPSE